MMVLSGKLCSKQGACVEKLLSHARAFQLSIKQSGSLRTLQLWGISQLFD
jgi:hypothetical protein